MRSIHMAGGTLTFNPGETRKTFRVGEMIQFYPQIVIDQHKTAETIEPYLKHVIYDIYEFSFKPIEKYFNNLHQDCYHYLIEIFSDLRLFCFNWTKPYKSYLKIGRWYEGYGQLRNCGNASEENLFIPSSVMSDIYTKGKLAGIYENLLIKDFSRNSAHTIKQFKYSKDVWCYEDALDWFGYFRDMEEFKSKTSLYREKFVQHDSTETAAAGSNIIFCVDLLDMPVDSTKASSENI